MFPSTFKHREINDLIQGNVVFHLIAAWHHLKSQSEEAKSNFKTYKTFLTHYIMWMIILSRHQFSRVSKADGQVFVFHS